MSAAGVRACAWSYRHAGRPEPVLTAVDLDLAAGELVVVVGASGSGKSTLLGALAGALPAQGASGSITIEPSRARVGVVGQQPEGNIVMERVGDDLAFPLENAGVPPAQIWPRVVQALDGVGLGVDLGRDTSRLSGGQQQLLALAAAMIVQPGLLLLDEPTANLDEGSAMRLREAVLALRGTTTIVVVEHRLRGWIEHADRVLVVADGRVRDVGNATGFAVALKDHPDTAAHVWTAGWQAPDMRPRRAPGDAVLTADGVGLAGRLPATDLLIRRGEVVAVTGPAGSGKSTLLACLSGLMRPDPGAAVQLRTAQGPTTAPDRPAPRGDRRGSRSAGPTWSSNPWEWPSSRVAGTFGVVFQNPEHQFVTSRAVDELRHGLVASGVAARHADLRAADMLERLGLATLAEANPFTLSGGEQRRLGVATALVLDPGVLVLDEPTFGQDPATWAEIAKAIADHRDAGGSVLMATHDRALVAALGATEVRLVAGSPGQDASATDARTRDGLRTGATGATGAIEPPGARGAGGGLRSLSPLALLGAAGLVSTAALLSASVALNLVLAGLVLAVAIVGRIASRRLALLAVPALVATASVALSNALLSASGPFSWEAWQAAALPASRVLAVALPGLVTAAALDPTALADSLMVRLRVSPRAALAVLAALRLLPLLQAEWEILARATRARGLVGTGPTARARQFASMTFRLLVAALRRGAKLAAAMEARGLSSGHERDPAASAEQDDRAEQAGSAEHADPVALRFAPRTIARPLRRSRWDAPLLLLGLTAVAAALVSRL